MTTAYLNSPLGPLVAGAIDQGICLLAFSDERESDALLKRAVQPPGSESVSGKHPHIQALETQMAQYFLGTRRDFEVPVVLAGTPFQERVWRRLMEIPYGQTISYNELSRRIGCSGGQRAVGRANGDNRIAIVVPCHRVIRANGDLGGYSGGLPRKRRLLDVEREGAVQGTLFQGDSNRATPESYVR